LLHDRYDIVGGVWSEESVGRLALYYLVKRGIVILAGLSIECDERETAEKTKPSLRGVQHNQTSENEGYGVSYKDL